MGSMKVGSGAMPWELALWCVAVSSSGMALGATPSHRLIDRVFASLDRPGSPGCVLGVIREGRFIYRRGYGSSSLELGIPLSSSSVFYMGSLSKQFTAASVLLAAEQGYFTLDDDVRRWIPELPDYGRRITLRQMLHHTSGLRDYYVLMALSGRSYRGYYPSRELITLVTRQSALNFEPGSRHSYSNTNYLLLGEVIRRATGRSLAAFAAEHIFRPLGMTSTRFYDDNTLVVPRRVMAYDTRPEGGFAVNWSTSFDVVGAGGLMSTIDDLLLWDRNFYDNRLGSGSLIREMQEPGVLSDGTRFPHAPGLLIQHYRGVREIEFHGALYGYRTSMRRFPDQRLTVLVFCNVSSANTINLSRQVADLYLANVLGPLPERPSTTRPVSQSVQDVPSPPPQPRETELETYAGIYQSPDIDAPWRLSVEQGRLSLLIGWADPIPLTQNAQGEFASNSGVRLAIERGDNDVIVGFVVRYSSVHGVRFKRFRQEFGLDISARQQAGVERPI